MKRFKEYLTEKFFGKLVTIFHRTNSIETINKIKELGFVVGFGNMYGNGIYSTYDIDSQLNDLMKSTYGDYIIKSKVQLYKVLILDYKEAKKVFGKKYTLIEQLTEILGKNFKITNEIINLSKELKNPKNKLTSDYAVRLLHYKEIKNNIHGISFTGSRDGKVLVIYEKNIVTPLSYNSTINNSKKIDNKTWNNIKNKELIKKGLSATLGQYYKIEKIYKGLKIEKIGNLIIIKENVILYDQKIKTLSEFFDPKFKFKILGNFDCSYNKYLIDFKGGPEYIEKDITIQSNNNLVSLEGGPEYVGGNFECVGHKKLKTLKGGPKKVEGNYICNRNSLISLEGSPKEIKGNFECERNNIKTLKGMPNIISGDFNCEDNNLENLDDITIIKGEIFSDF